jgi:hypothetical protein
MKETPRSAEPLAHPHLALDSSFGSVKSEESLGQPTESGAKEVLIAHAADF